MDDADVAPSTLAANRRQEMAGFNTIVLIAVDNNEPSEYAFNWYRDYIHRAENYVVILHCTDHNNQDFRDAKSPPESSIRGPGRTKTMLKDLAERMKAIEEKFGQWMQQSGIQGKIRKGTGKPGEAIIRAASEEGACMIVTGTRGHGKIKRAFLGSVSDYVVHHSAVPVIICRSKA